MLQHDICEVSGFAFMEPRCGIWSLSYALKVVFISNAHKSERWLQYPCLSLVYEGWNFNSGNYLFTTDTK